MWLTGPAFQRTTHRQSVWNPIQFLFLVHFPHSELYQFIFFLLKRSIQHPPLYHCYMKNIFNKRTHNIFEVFCHWSRYHTGQLKKNISVNAKCSCKLFCESYAFIRAAFNYVTESKHVLWKKTPSKASQRLHFLYFVWVLALDFVSFQQHAHIFVTNYKIFTNTLTLLSAWLFWR